MLTTLRRSFTPTDRTVNETTALFDVPRGARVVWASAEKNVLAAAGTGSTMTLGDGVDPDGYVTSTELDLGTGTRDDLIDGGGAYFDSSGGKLYSTPDTVDVVYTASGTPGATTPRVTFAIALAREWAG